jgi:hypothetical protein
MARTVAVPRAFAAGPETTRVIGLLGAVCTLRGVVAGVSSGGNEPRRSLADIDIPVYSIANWNQAGLHLRGNLHRYERVRGPKKLLVNGGPVGRPGRRSSPRLRHHPRSRR